MPYIISFIYYLFNAVESASVGVDVILVYFIGEQEQSLPIKLN